MSQVRFPCTHKQPDCDCWKYESLESIKRRFGHQDAMTPALAQVADHLTRAADALPDYAQALVHVDAATPGLPTLGPRKVISSALYMSIGEALSYAAELARRQPLVADMDEQLQLAEFVAAIRAWLVQQTEGVATAAQGT